jgi:hypothetical protein
MNRSELAMWAIRRAKEIVEPDGTEVALAGRELDGPAIEAASTQLAGDIVNAIIEAYEMGKREGQA